MVFPKRIIYESYMDYILKKTLVTHHCATRGPNSNCRPVVRTTAVLVKIRSKTTAKPECGPTVGCDLGLWCYYPTLYLL